MFTHFFVPPFKKLTNSGTLVATSHDSEPTVPYFDSVSSKKVASSCIVSRDKVATISSFANVKAI